MTEVYSRHIDDPRLECPVAFAALISISSSTPRVLDEPAAAFLSSKCRSDPPSPPHPDDSHMARPVARAATFTPDASDI